MKNFPKIEEQILHENPFRPHVVFSPDFDRVREMPTPQERVFAKWLKANGFFYEYEPYLFMLEVKHTGRLRGFQPDFWLPSLECLVEIGTIRRKNRKLRLMNQNWPNLKVIVIDSDEIIDLKRNHTPCTEDDFRVWIERQIQKQKQRLEEK